MSWADDVMHKDDAREKLVQAVISDIHNSVDQHWPDVLKDAEGNEEDRVLVYIMIGMNILKSANIALRSERSRVMLMDQNRKDKS